MDCKLNITQVITSQSLDSHQISSKLCLEVLTVHIDEMRLFAGQDIIPTLATSDT